MDKGGEPYILVSKVMEVLMAYGDPIANEHVTEIARECKPDR